jgi:tetratricopeptide (TPR) repeat protein
MAPNPAIPKDAIQKQIGKLAASRAFEGSARLRELLDYTVAQSLAGNGDQLKESVLGVEVFGRAPGYNSDSNSIVRVEFARLRKKLEEYYGSEGANDPVRIVYPRGSYNPEFRAKDAAAPTSFEGGVAVLPLVSAGSEDDECLADGITDELITALSRVRGLKVVARTSCFAFKGKSTDIREIGRALRVSSVLEGSLRRNQDVVRVHVQLIDVEDGCQLWGQKYERHLTGVFEVQDEIAGAIASALRIEFPRFRTPRQTLPTRDPAAHALYLKGRYWWHRWNPDALRRAAGYFQQVIERDASYAAPYSGLADSYFLQGFWGNGTPRDLMPRAQAAAKKAIDIDPQLAEAYCSLAMVENAWNWNTATCEAAFRRCMELNPGYALAQAKYATSYLSPLGRFEEAHGWLLRALELDPLSPNMHSDLALNFAHRGLHGEFEAEAAKVIEMNPDVPLKVRWYQMMSRGTHGDLAGAADAAEQAIHAAPEDPPTLGFAAWGFAVAGQIERAEMLRKRIEHLAQIRYVPTLAIAVAHLHCSSTDGIFGLLDRALEERDPWLRYLRVATPMHRFRSDARYGKLLEKLGLGE